MDNLLNSGDIFNNPNVLKKFSEQNFKNSDVVFGNTIVKNKLYKRYLLGKKLNSISAKMPFSHQSVFVKTKILKKYKFNTKYKIASDFDLFQKILKKKKFFHHFNYYVSQVSTGGISDLKRLYCLFEYFQIFIFNRKLINIFFQFFQILWLSIATILKKLLSNKIANKLLLLKYKLKNKIN